MLGYSSATKLLEIMVIGDNWGQDILRGRCTLGCKACSREVPTYAFPQLFFGWNLKGHSWLGTLSFLTQLWQ